MLIKLFLGAFFARISFYSNLKIEVGKKSLFFKPFDMCHKSESA